MQMQNNYRTELLVLLASLLLTNCGGGSNSLESNENPATVGSGISSQNDETVSDDTLFPAVGPVIDPPSTREEIASRADTLIGEYRTLMAEVLRQIDEVYRDISSGVESSPNPDILANDLLFVDTVNSACKPQFDQSGSMTGLLDCGYWGGQFAFRHPRYAGVKILVADYMLDANFGLGDETEIVISSNSLGLNSSQAIMETAVRIRTGKIRVNSYDDPPDIDIEFPAYTATFTQCNVYLSPTLFPENNLEVNKCSEVYRDIITVLQRLNER